MSKEKFVRDKPHVNIGLVISLLAIISGISLAAVVFIDASRFLDSDGDTVPDNDEEVWNHPLFFEIEPDAVRFQTFDTGNDSNVGHEVGHALGIEHTATGGSLAVTTMLFSDVATRIPNVTFGMEYTSMIQFVDANLNGFFDPANDSIVQETLLNGLNRLQVEHGVDGQPAYRMMYSTADARFTIEFYATKEHVLLGRQVGLVSPNEMISRVLVENFSPITFGTSLALKINLNSDQPLKFSPEGVSIRASALAAGENYTVELSWEGLGLIDGSKRMVNATVPAPVVPVTSGIIYINFGDATNVSFIPKLAWHLPVQETFSFDNIPWVYVTLGSTTLLSIVATSHIVRKKPGRVKYENIT